MQQTTWKDSILRCFFVGALKVKFEIIYILKLVNSQSTNHNKCLYFFFFILKCFGSLFDSVESERVGAV